MKKPFVTLLQFFLLCNFSVQSEGFQEASAKQPIAIDQIETVEYCDLIKKADAYDGKIIRTRVVMVSNHAPRLDGGDPHAFSPNCLEEENYCLLEAHSSQKKIDPQVLKELDELQRNRNKHGESKVWGTIVGQFEKAKNGFGHLDWAKYRISIINTEKVEKYQGK